MAIIFTLLFTAISFAQSRLGVHRVALILVNFQDKPTQLYDPAFAAIVASHAGSFYSANSYGATSLSTDVFGWFTISESVTTCNFKRIASKAQAAAGINPQNYQHLVYAFPLDQACGARGNSTIGGSPSQSWINVDILDWRILAHELGHGFGLYHSHGLDCGDLILATKCSVDEYGDHFDVMGLGFSMDNHFNAAQKSRLGWITPILAGPGTYTLSPYQQVGAALQILKDSKNVYFVEYRPYQNGVLIHQASVSDGNKIYVLDDTPLDSWDNVALVVGQTFTDGKVSITLLSADASGGATVSVKP